MKWANKIELISKTQTKKPRNMVNQITKEQCKDQNFKIPFNQKQIWAIKTTTTRTINHTTLIKGPKINYIFTRNDHMIEIKSGNLEMEVCTLIPESAVQQVEDSVCVCIHIKMNICMYM